VNIDTYIPEIHDNNVLINQLVEFVNTLSEQQFNDSLDMGCGTVGAHVRHVIEHYQSLLNANGTIDYDNRPRNALIETDKSEAISALNTITLKLNQINTDKQVNVLCSTNLLITATNTLSSLRRELVFVHSHTTHHMAIIRILALTMKLPISLDFGKAASTQKFEQHVQF
jgi:uncharacterized damage-inducible protein DinB